MRIWLALVIALLPQSAGAEALAEVLQGAELVDEARAKEILNVLRLDVLAHFDLAEEYPTPLQWKVFTKTEDYRAKKAELQGMRSALMKRRFYVKLQRFGEGRRLPVSNYDTRRKKFGVKIGSAIQTIGIEAHGYIGPMRCVQDFCFPAARSLVEQRVSGGSESWLLLPSSERDALRIEGADVDAFIVFSIDGIHTYRYVLRNGYRGADQFPRASRAVVLLVQGEDVLLKQPLR